MKRVKVICFLIFLAGLLSVLNYSQISSSASFTLQQSVISDGGGKSNSSSFVIEGTAGQPIAGILSTSTAFGVRSGFWQSPLAPTAALVTVLGRVRTADGMPIRGVRLTLFDMSGAVHYSLSNGFGYFHFDDVEAGRTYLLSATSKRFQFATQALTVNDSIVAPDLVPVP